MAFSLGHTESAAALKGGEVYCDLVSSKRLPCVKLYAALHVKMTLPG